MIKVKDLGVDAAHSKIISMCDENRYHSPQIEIFDKNKMADFLLFLNSIEDFSRVDELGNRDGVRRYPIDKEVNDILHKASTSIACGITVVKYPLMKLHEHQNWEGGYIEGFARMDADQKFVDWFYWSYVRMEHLKEILKEFEAYLVIL